MNNARMVLNGLYGKNVELAKARELINKLLGSNQNILSFNDQLLADKASLISENASLSSALGEYQDSNAVLHDKLTASRAEFAALQMGSGYVPASDHAALDAAHDRLIDSHEVMREQVSRLKHYIGVQSRMIDELINE